MMPLPRWVVDAARLPVAFAQVREDPLVDLAVLQRIHSERQSPPGRGGLSALMIASGGCTAAFLCASGLVSQLHLVDFNPAQMELCRLKLHLLQTADPAERLRILGHQPADENGGDYRGRYEVLFAQLRLAIRNSPPPALKSNPIRPRKREEREERREEEMPSSSRLSSRSSRFRGRVSKSSGRTTAHDSLDGLKAVLLLDDPVERAERLAPHTALGKVLDDAFDEVMALPNLVALFGQQATQNRRDPFGRHFAGRTRHAVASLPTANNPYLWQLLLGRFPDGVLYPWFTAAAPRQMPEITETIGTIDTALAAHHDRFDFVHLSNVLDWLSVEEAQTTLRLAFNALRPGGCVLIRQLNSTLDLPALGERFEWLADEANRLHAGDRSFFYRSLHLGRKR